MENVLEEHVHKFLWIWTSILIIKDSNRLLQFTSMHISTYTHQLYKHARRYMHNYTKHKTPFSSWVIPSIFPISSNLFLNIITDSYLTTPYLCGLVANSKTRAVTFAYNYNNIYFLKGLTIPFQSRALMVLLFPSAPSVALRNMSSNTSLRAKSPKTVVSR